MRFAFQFLNRYILKSDTYKALLESFSRLTLTCVVIQREERFIFATFQFIKRPDYSKKFSGLNSFVKIPTEIAMLEWKCLSV